MNNLELDQAWAETINRIKQYPEVSAPQVDALFARLHPQAISEGFLMLTADNDFIKKHIESNFLTYIRRALEEFSNVPYTVAIEVDEPPASQAAPSPSAAGAPAAPAVAPPMAAASIPAAQDYGAGETPYQISTPPIANATAYPQAAAGRDPESLQTLSDVAAGAPKPEPRSEGGFPSDQAPAPDVAAIEARPREEPVIGTMLFRNFVVGDSNAVAFNAAMQVAEHPGLPTSNPLFIYGKSGLGKTHLLRAIENYIEENMPYRQTVYVDANTLVDDYVEAGRAQAQDKSSYKSFKGRYESADVLLVDDVQHLQGKKMTLDAVFQMFNKLIDNGKQIILSADRSPSNIDIDERYTSRFNQGMTCDVQPPTLEIKVGIIKNYIDDLCQMDRESSFQLSREVQMYIAEISGSNIRELKGAINRVNQHMKTFQMDDITIPEVKNVLDSYFSSGPSRRILVPDVQREVEAYYKVSHADLIGKKRSRNIAHARHVAIYLCREMIDLPFGDIGKQFGNRDHTTIMYAYKTVGQKLPRDRALFEEMELIRQSIREA